MRRMRPLLAQSGNAQVVIIDTELSKFYFRIIRTYTRHIGPRSNSILYAG